MTDGARHIEADLVLDGRWELGEGPIWDTRRAELVWVDIMGDQVLRWRPGEARARALPTPLDIGSVAVRQAGGYVAALADGFWVVDEGSTDWRRFAPVEADRPDLRFNDGKCDPSGRFLAGSMAYDKRPGAGGFYRLDPDGSVEQLADGISISNGLTWTPDGRTLYYIDTPTRKIDVFDYDPETGAATGRRTHIELPDDEPGNLDGMTMDTEGGLWVALWDGSRVVRFAPGGGIDVVVDLPVSHVTSCIFGGPDLTDLFITCAWSELTDEERAAEPHAGSLFRVRPGFGGYPPVEFAG
jgi:sugar lactone lactonase YvrE